MRINFIIVCWFALLILGCQPKAADIAGDYLYQKDDVRISLHLGNGGVYSEEIVIDGSLYNAHGAWSLDSETIKLRDFLLPIDSHSGRILNPPQLTLCCDAFSEPDLQGVFFDDLSHDNYSLKRVITKAERRGQ